jgi:hypothetical protein
MRVQPEVRGAVDQVMVAALDDGSLAEIAAFPLG